MSHILLQRWVAGRMRTPGRFWRNIRRINAHSIDLATATTRLIALALCALYLIAMAGCTRTCAPMHGDSSSFVLSQCGSPTAVEQTTTSYGSLRQEWDYGDTLVVLEDGSVLSVIKVQVAVQQSVLL
jgi:hypothetical protein